MKKDEKRQLFHCHANAIWKNEQTSRLNWMWHLGHCYIQELVHCCYDQHHMLNTMRRHETLRNTIWGSSIWEQLKIVPSTGTLSDWIWYRRWFFNINLLKRYVYNHFGRRKCKKLCKMDILTSYPPFNWQQYPFNTCPWDSVTATTTKQYRQWRRGSLMCQGREMGGGRGVGMKGNKKRKEGKVGW